MSLISDIEKFHASEGYVTIFRRIFLSHSTETFRGGTLLSCISGKFLWRKNSWIRGRVKYQDFPSKIFCLTVPKKIVGEHLRMSLISGTRFLSNFFSSSSLETVPGGTFVGCVSKNSRERKRLWIRRGEYQNFPWKLFLSHSAKKFRSGTL